MTLVKLPASTLLYRYQSVSLSDGSPASPLRPVNLSQQGVAHSVSPSRAAEEILA